MAKNKRQKFSVRATALSPIHLGSGKGDVTVDAEVAHDAYGLPYFPAKRFKGLLFESALEVVEIMGERSLFSVEDVRTLFRHIETKASEGQLILSSLRLENYDEVRKEWAYLEDQYPELFRPSDVLEQYTSLRYQTKINRKTRAAKDTSLHNMRVVDKGVTFVGELVLENANENALPILVLALRNLEHAGLKRNRGFGRIRCELLQDGQDAGKAILTEALDQWKRGGGQ